MVRRARGLPSWLRMLAGDARHRPWSRQGGDPTVSRIDATLLGRAAEAP